MIENADLLFQKILELSPIIVDQVILRMWFNAWGMLGFAVAMGCSGMWVYSKWATDHEDARVASCVAWVLAGILGIISVCNMIAIAYWPELLVLEKLIPK